jgi:hypothetical protein
VIESPRKPHHSSRYFETVSTHLKLLHEIDTEEFDQLVWPDLASSQMSPSLSLCTRRGQRLPQLDSHAQRVVVRRLLGSSDSKIWWFQNEQSLSWESAKEIPSHNRFLVEARNGNSLMPTLHTT